MAHAIPTMKGSYYLVRPHLVFERYKRHIAICLGTCLFFFSLICFLFFRSSSDVCLTEVQPADIHFIVHSSSASDDVSVSRFLMSLFDSYLFTMTPTIHVLSSTAAEDTVRLWESFPRTTAGAPSPTLPASIRSIAGSVTPPPDTRPIVCVMGPGHLMMGPLSPAALEDGVTASPSAQWYCAAGESAVADVAKVGDVTLPRPSTRPAPSLLDLVDGERRDDVGYSGRFAPRPTFVYPARSVPDTIAPRPVKRYTTPGTPLQKAFQQHRARLDDRLASGDWVGVTLPCPVSPGDLDPTRHAFVWFIPDAAPEVVAYYTRFSLTSALSVRGFTKMRLMFVYQTMPDDTEADLAFSELGIEKVAMGPHGAIPTDVLEGMDPLFSRYRLVMHRLSVLALNDVLPEEAKVDKIVTVDADMLALSSPDRVFCHPSAFSAVMERQQDWFMNGGLAVYDLVKMNGPSVLDKLMEFGRGKENPCLFETMWAYSEQELLSCYFLNEKRNLPLLGNYMSVQDSPIFPMATELFPQHQDIAFIHQNARSIYSFHTFPQLPHRRFMTIFSNCISGSSRDFPFNTIENIQHGICGRCHCAHRGGNVTTTHQHPTDTSFATFIAANCGKWWWRKNLYWDWV